MGVKEQDEQRIMLRKRKTMKTVVEKIGPATATKYLECAPPNRRVDPKIVDSFAKLMIGGRWRHTHQGIAFNETHGLVDGQHRLHAIVKSGKTVTMNVARGLTGDDIMVIDSGKARTAGDRLMIAGVVTGSAAIVAAIVTAMAIAESGACPRLSPDMMKTIIEHNPNGIRFAMEAFHSKSNSGWNAIIRGAFAYCYAFAPQKVDELAKLVFFKENLKAGSAAHTFVLMMSDGRLSKIGSTGRADTMARVLTIIRAHIEGREVRRVCATASIFTWAQQQREAHNIVTIGELIA
jgi:hypothetical protein